MVRVLCVPNMRFFTSFSSTRYPGVLAGKLLKGIFGFNGEHLVIHHLYEVESLAADNGVKQNY